MITENNKRPKQKNGQWDYKQSFSIEKRTEYDDMSKWYTENKPVRKKYSVWTGMHSYDFWTLQEARTFILLESEKNRYLYETSKEIYKEILNHYVEKFLKYGKSEHYSYNPKDILNTLIDTFDYLKNSSFVEHLPAKIWVAFGELLKAAELFEMKFLINRINDIYNNNYPKREYEYTPTIIQEQIKENEIAKRKHKKRKVVRPVHNLPQYEGDANQRTRQMINTHHKK